MINPATGAIEAVQGFEGAKHLNPQWSPDSQALYFISDRGGVPNLYRVGLGCASRVGPDAVDDARDWRERDHGHESGTLGRVADGNRGVQRL